MQIGSAKYLAEEGCAFLIRAYDVHQYRPLSEEWILYIIGFDGEASEPVMRTLDMESSGIYIERICVAWVEILPKGTLIMTE